ncbi:hypothetical protein [Pantoea trifolii]|uniref:Uncharacterized protein n=1 Tax=Pantoea trifolii TaxID=2968030 RepID=A0ABT1VIG9_9GAMM|nr:MULTISPECIES: hypothetical protein [unclassified Pantoea]MCQ8227275.1 hypothetical protein [Pantoea sp. MMK2]MCQ8235447.1 hypothetical protein [Pantoea sp. MMK3]
MNEYAFVASFATIWPGMCFESARSDFERERISQHYSLQEDSRKDRYTKTKKPPLGGYDITAYCFILFVLSTANMVPGAGLEPAQP